MKSKSKIELKIENLDAHKSLITVFLCLYISQLTWGASELKLNNRRNFFMATIQITNHINSSPLYKESRNSNYINYQKNILRNPMPYVSIGLNTSKVINALDISYFNRTGSYQVDLGYDKVKIKYIAYNLTYKFLVEKRIPIKPTIALNMAYIHKKYDILVKNDWGGGSSFSEYSSDNSKSLIIQIPIGICTEQRQFFFSIAFTYNVFSWMKGSIYNIQESYNMSRPTFTKSSNINYHGTTSNELFIQQNNLLTLRIGYIIPRYKSHHEKN